MQTFLPYPNFDASAAVLDDRRLGKQRVEAKQILLTLEKGPMICGGCRVPRTFIVNSRCECHEAPYFGVHKFIKTPWYNHPAVKMWRGAEFGLAEYGAACCVEWLGRGFNDTLREFFLARMTHYGKDDTSLAEPTWLGDVEFHLSHQSNLIRKDPGHYGPLFPGVPADLPYVWPNP